MVEQQRDNEVISSPPTISRRKALGLLFSLGAIVVAPLATCDGLKVAGERNSINDYVAGLGYPGRQQVEEAEKDIADLQQTTETLARQGRLEDITKTVDQPRLQKAYQTIDELNAPAKIRQQLMEEHHINDRISRDLIINFTAVGVAATGFVLGQKDKIVQFYNELRYS